MEEEVLLGSSELGGPVVDLIGAGTEVWVEIVVGFLQISGEAELEGSVVDGGHDHPDIEESRDEGASDGVHVPPTHG